MTGSDEVYQILSADTGLNALISTANLYSRDTPDTLDKQNDLPWGVITDLPGNNDEHASNQSVARLVKAQVSIWVPPNQDNVDVIEQAMDDALEKQGWYSNYSFNFMDTTYELFEITRRYVKHLRISR